MKAKNSKRILAALTAGSESLDTPRRSTPLPWRQGSTARGSEYAARVVANWNGKPDTSATVAKTGPHDPYVSWEEAEGNAALIVEAVNAHAALVAAAQLSRRNVSSLILMLPAKAPDRDRKPLEKWLGELNGALAAANVF